MVCLHVWFAYSRRDATLTHQSSTSLTPAPSQLGSV